MATKKSQKTHSYFAVFDPAKEGGYSVSFPDFPGCVTFGRTFEEAKEKAQEVLELWVAESRCVYWRRKRPKCKKRAKHLPARLRAARGQAAPAAQAGSEASFYTSEPNLPAPCPARQAGSHQKGLNTPRRRTTGQHEQNPTLTGAG